MSITPVSLLERLRRPDDSAAWQRLLAIYQPWLRNWLHAHGVPTNDCDDLVQELLVVVLRELPQFRHSGRPEAFRAWLRGIIVNRWRVYHRQRRDAADCAAAEQALEQLADDGSELSHHWDREHDRHVAQQLLTMVENDFEPRTWQAFRMMVQEGRRASEVAAELGMSEGAVWAAKSRVLARLRQTAKELLD